jgi:hypothetical protein
LSPNNKLHPESEMSIAYLKKTDNVKNENNIKFDKSNISSCGGLVIFYKFLKRIGLEKLLKNKLSLEIGRNRNKTNIPVVERLMSLILSITGGFHRMYHVDYLKDNMQFKTIKAGLFSFTSTTLSRTLKKFCEIHVQELYTIFHKLLKSVLKGTSKITIDVDSTVTPVYGNQDGAMKGYNPHKKGLKSYHPLLAFIYEKKLLLHGILRPGNSHTSFGVNNFIRDALLKLPKGVNKIFLRGDSGFYKSDFIDYLENCGRIIRYVIKIKMKNMISNLRLGAIKDWKDIGYGLSISETTYKAPKWDKTRRIIVLRKEIKYHDKEQLIPHIGYEFFCFVTNLNWKPETVLSFYNKRAGAENYIKDFKYGYGWGKMLTYKYWANKVIFISTMLAYNLSNLFFTDICLEKGKTIISLRFKYIYQAAAVSYSGRKYILHFERGSPLKEPYQRLLSA